MSSLAKLKWSTRCLNHLVLYAYFIDAFLGGADDHRCSMPDTEAMRAITSSAEDNSKVGLFMAAAHFDPSLLNAYVIQINEDLCSCTVSAIFRRQIPRRREEARPRAAGVCWNGDDVRASSLRRFRKMLAAAFRSDGLLAGCAIALS